MGRKSLENQVIHRLNSKMALGSSRHAAKHRLRISSADKYSFTASIDTIHSIATRNAYQQTALEFVGWCMGAKGVKKYARLDSCKELAPDYLQARIEAGKSLWTLKKDRSALGKLFGSPIDFPVEARTPDKIVRSRGPKPMDQHFSEKNNRDLVVIAKATGGRREDLGKLTPDDFRVRGGHLCVLFRQSKGGRDRISPVRPDLEQDVLAILSKARAEGRVKLFERVHTKADIHACRREYARELYRLISQDRLLRDQLLSLYPARYEPHIKSDVYATRRLENNRRFDRDDLYLISQALGHNRLEVAATHYLL